MQERTRVALEGSIAKWDAIAAGTGIDQGSANCPLCQAHPHCKGCPVAKAAGAGDCYGTPYWDFLNHVEDDHRHGVGERIVHRCQPGCAKCVELATAERDFLTSLRPAPASEAGQ